MVILNLPLTLKSLRRNRIKLEDNRGCAVERAIGTYVLHQVDCYQTNPSMVKISFGFAPDSRNDCKVTDLSRLASLFPFSLVRTL